MRLFVLAVAVLTTGCVTSEPSGNRPEDRITIAMVDAGRSRGVEVGFLVEANLERTSRAIAVEALPQRSNLVTMSQVIQQGADSGVMTIRFRPEIGLAGSSVYRYRTDRSTTGEFRYEFQIAPAHGGTWKVNGAYVATPEGDACRVSYRFTSSHAALRRDQLSKLIRRDASRIMAAAEKH